MSSQHITSSDQEKTKSQIASNQNIEPDLQDQNLDIKVNDLEENNKESSEQELKKEEDSYEEVEEEVEEDIPEEELEQAKADWLQNRERLKEQGEQLQEEEFSGK